MWKCKKFSATQILREIRFDNYGVSKTGILTFFWVSEFRNFVQSSHVEFSKKQKIKIKELYVKCLKLQFLAPELHKLDFT